MQTKDYFLFRGRMNRKPYWLKGSLVFLIGTIFYLIATDGLLLDSIFLDPLSGEENDSTSLTLFLYALLVPAFWPLLAISAQRLHDRSKSAWWLLPFFLLPLVFQYIGDLLEGTLALVFNLIAFSLYVWGTVELCFLRGTDGPNQYGPDPRQPTP
jgi:uncharacterized membrane protein YhaH (DUF805 family)